MAMAVILLSWSPMWKSSPKKARGGNAKARTVQATWSSIGELLITFKPNESSNYFTNAGYGSV